MKTANKRLRIAVLHRVFASRGGGAERYAVSLVEQLAARHEIHVFSQEREHDWPGVSYHRIAAIKRPRWINQLWYATATWWQTRRGFDIVHSHENTWHGNVQTVHVLPVWHSLFAGRSGWALWRRYLQAFTSPRLWTYLGLESCRFSPGAKRRVVVPSEALRATMQATFPHAAPMLRVVLPGVVIDEQRAQRAQARASLGVPEHAPCVLLVGNDLGRKGLPALLQALQELPPEVMVLAVGHASRIPTFRAMADQMGLTQRVVFHAEMQDIRLAYCCADILAHPTLADTFAMVVLEAMACAVPVVVSGPAYCGIAQLLTEGENALLLDDPQDAKALATALRRLLTDAPLHAKLAQAGVEFAKLHEWQCKAAEQEAIYLELAANERIA